MAEDHSRYSAGIHAVRHVLQSEQHVIELLIEKGKSHPRINELVHLAKQQNVPVRFLPTEAMARLAGKVNHQGAIARLAPVHKKQAVSLASWLKTLDDAMVCHVLLLDQISDPHNLGACLRTAEAAGCAAVIVPRDRSADLHSPVVSKTACGALARLNVFQVSNLGRAMQSLQEHGFWLYGMAGEAETSLFEIDFPARTALVMGSEGNGLRRMVREHCDQLLRIPMPGTVESLNVSVATGISLFEILRQQGSSE